VQEQTENHQETLSYATNQSHMAGCGEGKRDDIYTVLRPDV